MRKLDRESIALAIRYNLREIAEGRVYVDRLPYPLCGDIDNIGMVGWIYAFQCQMGISPDGRLDPETYELLRTDEDTISMKIDPCTNKRN